MSLSISISISLPMPMSFVLISCFVINIVIDINIAVDADMVHICLCWNRLLLLLLPRLVRAAGKLEEAEPLQRRAVEIGEKVLGSNSPDLATWVNNLGRLLMVRGRGTDRVQQQKRSPDPFSNEDRI